VQRKQEETENRKGSLKDLVKVKSFDKRSRS
jgi:hypothetical protein